MMKKHFWMMAVVLMAMAATLASCSGKDGDSNGNGGEEDAPANVGTGAITIDGQTLNVFNSAVGYSLKWGATYGEYSVTLWANDPETGDELSAAIYFSEAYLNDTYSLTEDWTEDDVTMRVILNGESYWTDSHDFKEGSMKVTLDKDGNMTVAVQGVANHADIIDDDDVHFSFSYAGQVHVAKEFGKEPAPKPDVPWGDGRFTGNPLSFTLNGSTRPFEEVLVSYTPGPVGEYEIDFNYHYETVFILNIPLDHVGGTYNLKDDLTGSDGKTELYMLVNDLYYYNKEGDFKSGTLNVNLDKDGNLSIDIHGVANSASDDSDSDQKFDITFSGNGKVNDTSN